MELAHTDKVYVYTLLVASSPGPSHVFKCVFWPIPLKKHNVIRVKRNQ